MDKSGKVADSERGSSCPGCEWRIEDADCFGEECRILACPNDDGTTSPLQAVSVRTPDTDWRVAGYLCLEDEDDVVTTADIGEQVRQDWEALVPELRPTVQPPNGRTIVNLPTFFHSGQPERMPSTTVPVFDFQIDLTARGEWTWRFEPGVARTFTVPGSHWNDSGPKPVQHTYSTKGDRTVVLNVNWWGSFTVNGNGPYDIETPATQGPYALRLTVVDGRPILTD